MTIQWHPQRDEIDIILPLMTAALYVCASSYLRSGGKSVGRKIARSRTTSMHSSTT